MMCMKQANRLCGKISYQDMCDGIAKVRKKQSWLSHNTTEMYNMNVEINLEDGLLYPLQQTSEAKARQNNIYKFSSYVKENTTSPLERSMVKAI